MFAYDLLVVKAGAHGAATHLCECLLIQSLILGRWGWTGRTGPLLTCVRVCLLNRLWWEAGLDGTATHLYERLIIESLMVGSLGWTGWMGWTGLLFTLDHTM